MARRRFFVPEVRRGLAELTGQDAEHLVRVLRAEAGQRYEISDDRDVYLAEITSARKSAVCFEVIEKLPPQREARSHGSGGRVDQVRSPGMAGGKGDRTGCHRNSIFRSRANGSRLAAGRPEADGKVGEDRARGQPTGTARSSPGPVSNSAGRSCLSEMASSYCSTKIPALHRSARPAAR